MELFHSPLSSKRIQSDLLNKTKKIIKEFFSSILYQASKQVSKPEFGILTLNQALL